MQLEIIIHSIASHSTGKLAATLPSWRLSKTFPSQRRSGVSRVTWEAVSWDVGDRERQMLQTTNFKRPRSTAISTDSVDRQCQQQRRVVAHGRSGRSVLYDDMDSYVLMEPGRDEQFVTQQELETKLRSWLVKWPANDLPDDLSCFETVDEAVSHLVASACELDLGGGLGSVQWYQVRLES